MALPFHNKVTLRGFHFEDFHLTMNLSGLGSVTNSSTVVGKAVALDPTAANTARLAGEGDTIIGRLASFENRTAEGIVVGAVELKFANTLPVASAAQATIAVGDTVIGAGAGEVKPQTSGSPAASDPDHTVNFVAEVLDNGATVVVVKV